MAKSQLLTGNFFKGYPKKEMKNWDDGYYLKKAGDHQVSKIHIYHDNRSIIGLKVVYLIHQPSKKITSGKHFGKY